MSESLWQPAPHVKENLGQWGGEDPKRETNKWSAPALEAGRWRSDTLNLAVLGTRRCMGFVRQIYLLLNIKLGTAVAQWLRCCATNRKVAGSIPAGVIGIFL